MRISPFLPVSVAVLFAAVGCSRRVVVSSPAPSTGAPPTTPTTPTPVTPTPVPVKDRGVDIQRIVGIARDLADDSLRGRGPWTRENEHAARRLASELTRLGARPLFGGSLLVPFATEPRPRDTVFNVIGVLPNRSGSIAGERVGITSHLDHLGVGAPDSTGDRIYNGFLDDAMGIGMVLDVARRYVASPGNRPLVVMFFNLEEQGLLGSKALLARPDAGMLVDSLALLIGVDAGAPAGEAIEWQLMGAQPPNAGGILADSLARARGWSTTASAPRPISDVFPFSQRGVPILFPIPGPTWRDFTAEQRAAAMKAFDHYHSPADEYDPDFPLTGTEFFADWLWDIVRLASRR